MTAEIQEILSYVKTFITERPRNGFDAPHSRLLSALKLNEELADYFKDRAQIEDVYAKSIAKLAKKNYITSKSALGTFLPLWEMLQMELTRLASVHSEYSSTIVENIENPLRACIPDNADYADIHMMYDHIQKIAREYDELDTKIHKYKKNAKGEAKAADYTKQQEQKVAEWNKTAPQCLEKHQKVDEFRWDSLRSTIHKFESIQQTHAERIIELTGNNMTTAANLRTDDEIAAFCASFSRNRSEHDRPQEQPQLISIDNVVPEPSMSDSSLNYSGTEATLSPPRPSGAGPVKKEKKKFFSGLVSMRRKLKTESHHSNELTADQTKSQRQRSISNAGSFNESSSFHSIKSHITTPTIERALSKSASTNNMAGHAIEIVTPTSPASKNPPSLRKTPSFNGSLTNSVSSQQQQPAPLILVDAEGFSIPPPDRGAWPTDVNTINESLLDTDDMGSDAGSMLSNPRIRVDIKNEVISEEDASQSAVALTRVATLLKEKNSGSAPASRRLRGRREMRATQLYSVIEQQPAEPTTDATATINQGSAESTPTATATTSPHIPSLSNPFEMNQEKITEEEMDDLPSINVHVTETVHVLLRGGEVQKSIVLGEIGIEYKGPVESATPICFQISQNDMHDSVELTDFVSVLDGYTLQDNLFKVNTQLIHQRGDVVCIKYQHKLDNDRVPLTVKPIWKCDGDKSRLLVKYHKHAQTAALQEVIFVTSVTGDVQNALSIPAGELALAQKRIKWHLGDIDTDEDQDIKAQFTTLEQATPQPVAIRFETKDELLTDVNVHQGADPMVLWAKICNITKTVKAGKYIAEP